MEGQDGSGTPGPNYLLDNNESDYFNHNFVKSTSVVFQKHSLLLNKRNGSKRNRKNMVRSSLLEPMADRAGSLQRMLID